MNAVPPRPPDPEAAARTARHLRQLEELAELGMAMARVVAQTALHPDAEIQSPETTAPATPPGPNRCDPGLVFARLARAVRQTIALEARIVADRDGRAAGRPPPPPPDPRRPLLRRAIRDGAEPDADRATAREFQREVDERIEDELATDPEGHVPVEDILAAICADLGIRLDYSRLPDEVLGPAAPDPDPQAPEGPAEAAPPMSPAFSRPHGPDPP